MCLLGPLNMFLFQPFDKQINIYLKVQKLSVDFWNSNSEILIEKMAAKNPMSRITINLS